MSVNRESYLVQLRQVTLLRDLARNETALRELAVILEERTYGPGEPILEEGRVGAELYILVSGEVDVVKTTPEGDSFKVAVLSAGKGTCPVFGESGLIDSEPRSATIQSATETRCLILDREAFDGFGVLHPEWALPVYRRIAESVLSRFKRTNDDLMLLYKALMAEIRGD